MNTGDLPSAPTLRRARVIRRGQRIWVARFRVPAIVTAVRDVCNGTQRALSWRSVPVAGQPQITGVMVAQQADLVGVAYPGRHARPAS